MSKFNHNSRRNCFGSGVIFAAMALMATVAFGDTINYSTYVYSGTNSGEAAEWNSFQSNLVASPKVQITSVVEVSSGNPPLNPDVPLLTPLIPTSGVTPNGASVSFNPVAFVQVDTSGTAGPPFDMKTKTSNLTMLFTSTKNTSGVNPEIAGYAIDRISLQLTGAASVQAPFYSPPFVSAAYAQFETNFELTLQKLNYINVDTPITRTVAVPLLIENQGTGVVSSATSTWNTTAQATSLSGASAASYTWDTGVLSLDSQSLRTLFGITAPDLQITEVSLSLVNSVTAAGIYGQGKSEFNGINASVDTAPVAVPEPPTIILAGLGAAAVVANGYRRRKQRSQDSDEGDDQGQAAGDLNGAIALTA